MLNIPGYKIKNLISESNNSLVYRGIRIADKKSVILKVHRNEYPLQEEVERYLHEFNITRSFDFKGIIKAYNLEKYHNMWVMVLEDFGGDSLRNIFIQRKFSLKEVVYLAIQLVKILDIIHKENIIHKDINPANI